MPETTTAEHVAAQFLDAAQDAARAAERMKAAEHPEHESVGISAVPCMERFRASLERKPRWDVDPRRFPDPWTRSETGHMNRAAGTAVEGQQVASRGRHG